MRNEIMKNVIASLKTAFNFDIIKSNKAVKQQILECNYTNNYYGDQQCQFRSAKK